VETFPERIDISRRAVLVVGAALALLAAAGWLLLGPDPRSEAPAPVSAPAPAPGTPQWARLHYGNPGEPGFVRRRIVSIAFLGRTMFLNRAAQRHFLRLARLFEARAPAYAAAVDDGELDDWSYENRRRRGAEVRSNHAFGLAVDINALANPLGTAGEMPEEVVRQWEKEGGEWGGDWQRPDPMHFETHLTPRQIRKRYRADGTPRRWYLDRLTGR
jgi:hypothetical protein